MRHRKDHRNLSRNSSHRLAMLRNMVTDRKSTRLNSSHLGISYAVFCLKKKTTELATLIFAIENDLLERADGTKTRARGVRSTDDLFPLPAAAAIASPAKR